MEHSSRKILERILTTGQADVPSALKDRALASAVEGITISDPSLPDNPLIYVNSGFEQMTGYTAGEVLGRNCRFLQGSDTDPAASEEIRQAIREDRPCVVELLNYRKDGSTFWNRLSVTPIKDEQGNTTHYIGVQSDITRRKEVEEALRQAKEEVEQANEGMKQALRSAAQIQQALLPEKPICTREVHIESRLIACDELAGDILNYFWLDSKRIGCYVLDVVGHGVPAALYSVTLSHFLSPNSAKSFVYSSVESETETPMVLSPAEVAEELNKAFRFETKAARFFTLIYGIYDTESLVFEYVSAGHPYVIHQTDSGDTLIQRTTGFPIGVVETPHYENTRISLRPGERLFIYSDGLIEVQDPQGEMLNEEGLCAILKKNHKHRINKALRMILEGIKEFSGREYFADDVSILALNIPGN